MSTPEQCEVCGSVCWQQPGISAITPVSVLRCKCCLPFEPLALIADRRALYVACEVELLDTHEAATRAHLDDHHTRQQAS